MSDGSSIPGAVADAVKDLGKETIKQIVGTPGSVAKGAAQQVVNTDTAEEAAKKQQEDTIRHQRIRQIEAEMAAIRQQNNQNKGPEIPQKEDANLNSVTDNNSTPKLDEASRQAVGRAEQGRNFKG